MKQTALFLAFLLCLNVSAQVRLRQQKTDNSRMSLTFYNESGKPLGSDWKIYFCVLPTKAKSLSPQVEVRDVNANFFELKPTEGWETLADGDSLTISLLLPGVLRKVSHLPEGYYFVGADGQPQGLNYSTEPFALEEYAAGVQSSFLRNLRLPSRNGQLEATDIIPSVKEVVHAEGTCKIGKGFVMACSDGLETEARLLKEKLQAVHGLKETPKGVVIELSIDNSLPTNNEGYRLEITPKRILLKGRTSHGVFNASQTLLAVIQGKRLPCLTVNDEPDLPYRGVMIDISRNFTKYEELLRLLDVLSAYKLNALHLHLADDEGWRLEIPGLPELTEVGARRGHTQDENRCLYPGYDGNWDANASSFGNGFLTRKQFIALVRYAAERHIRVIPEIECPGHARAAIVSMKARYQKYKDTDPQKASEYLLSESADTSRYSSAQAYTDNVMNIALPSATAFVTHVIDEIAAMYDEAGVQLKVLHLGGDEVPEGSWLGSPACQRLMQEKQFKGREELSSYFYAGIIRYLEKKGIKYAGWQEIASAHEPLHTPYFKSRAGSLNCWNTVPEWNTDQLTYRLANEGYPVLLSNVTNCYMDMSYSPHPDERGLHWGGYVDEAISFALLPFDIYRSVHYNVAMRPIDWAVPNKEKEALTATGRQNVLGVQGQLFAETLRGVKHIEYCLFPKMAGLLERGWNAHPSWEKLEGLKAERNFYAELARFYDKLSRREMPKWDRMKIQYRLPHPGLSVKGGTLKANTPIDGAEIRYTTNGTEPTRKSKCYKGEVSLPKNCKVVKAKLFFGNRQSYTSVALCEEE